MIFHPENGPDCDVVFVHGLNGDGKSTWTSHAASESFWPNWLAADLESAAIWTVSYDVKMLAWVGGTQPLADRASNILSLLIAHGLGSRPLVFVCHSFGGIVVKQMMRNALELGEPQWKQLAVNTKGIYFLATPHFGSAKADWFIFFTSFLGPSVAMEELRSQDAQLRNLNLWYRNNALSNGIQTAVLCESKPTKGVLIVDAGSADPGIAEVIPEFVDTDHVDISKPDSRDSHVYCAVRHSLRGWLSTDFVIDAQSRVVVRIDLGPGIPWSEFTKKSVVEEGTVIFPDGEETFPKGSLIAADDAVYFALKKPSVALRSSIEFMQRWHERVLQGSPDCRTIIDNARIPLAGAPVLKDIAEGAILHLPAPALYVSEAIIDSSDRTMPVSLESQLRQLQNWARSLRPNSKIHGPFEIQASFMPSSWLTRMRSRSVNVYLNS